MAYLEIVPPRADFEIAALPLQKSNILHSDFFLYRVQYKYLLRNGKPVIDISGMYLYRNLYILNIIIWKNKLNWKSKVNDGR